MAGIGAGLLSQLLPMLGAGAGGFMQGRQQGVQENQIKQLMALKEAEEMRTQLLFPKTLRAADQQYATGQQTYNQAAERFPFEQKIRQQNIAQNEFQYGDALPEFMAAARSQYPAENIPEGMQRPDLMAMLGQYETEANRGAANYRATAPRPGDPLKRRDRLFSLYNQALEHVGPIDSIIASDPEVSAAYRGMNSNRERLIQWLETELAREGVNVGAKRSVSADDRMAQEIGNALRGK